MTSDRRLPVAIVGGGFSGTMVAAQLARRGIDSVLIEGSGRTAKGIAYSTLEPAHVLNVRAEMMSAWPDKPDDFARLVEADGGTPRDFAERRFFARYLRSALDEATASGHVAVAERMAVAAEPGARGWTVRLANGDAVEASAIVLAIGNQPPEQLPFASGAGKRVIANPWSEASAAAVANLAQMQAAVLIVGTGLTMIDAVLSLDAVGHRGRIVALSRRGLVPRAHIEFAPAPVEADDLPTGHVGKLWRWLRRRGAEVGWRAAVDSLRPHSHALWQALPLHEQQRFARHARPWWDVHRHRIAPEVARRIHELVAEGRLEIVAGRILSVRDDEGALAVSYRRRGSSHEEGGSFAFLFNCTGPLGRIERTRDSLLKGMLAAGLARPDPLGIGLDVDARSRVAGSDRAWAMGPLTKGRYWEIIAVPDIRGQAAAVAEDIARELGR